MSDHGRNLLVLALAVFAATLSGASTNSEAPRTWIVVFESHAARDSLREDLPPAVIALEYSLLPALVARLTDAEAKALAALRTVRSIEADSRVTISSVADLQTLTSGQVMPWGVAAIRAPEAWNASNKGAGAIVAVLDTGMKLDHPDLPTPLASQSFVTGEAVDDGNGHGTHMAGTIAARDNSLGVIGVAPEADLLIGKVINNAGSGSYADVIAGIDWAVQQGADIINMGFGGGAGTPALNDAVDAAWNAGVFVVSMAGNSGPGPCASYPAAYDSAISVAAVDIHKDQWSYSCSHGTVDLAAPGDQVLSTWTDDNPVAAAHWGGAGHEAYPIDGGAEGTVSADVYDCGLATGSGSDICPAAVSGNIAHIRRGSISTADQVAHAQSMGAAGVIYSNNAPGFLSPSVPGPNPLVLLTVSQVAGDDLVVRGDGTFAEIEVVQAPYLRWGGTAPAAAHVSGALALLVGCAAPNATASDIRGALEFRADDLGSSGWDTIFGHGLVDVFAALAAVAGCPLSADAGADRTAGSAGGAASAFVGFPLGGAPTAAGGRGPYSLLWTSLPAAGFTLSDSAAANPIFTGTTIGSYSLNVDVSDTGGALASDSVTVEVVCPTELELSGLTLTGDIETFEAVEKITATNSSVAAGADVGFRAGQTVVLADGFKISSGASFSAAIDPAANCEP